MKKNDVIIKQLLDTEKSSKQRGAFNQYSFEVDCRANRVEIKKIIENIFNVNVISVNTMHIRGKIKRRGRIIGKRKDWKKAVVKLGEGQRINFEGGV